jgi:hypothetical protein
MTTDHTIPAHWVGQTVAVIGNPSWVTAELVKTIKADHYIAANSAILKVPHAEYLVAIDGNWPAEAESLPAQRIVGIRSEKDALYVQLPYEAVALSARNVVQFRSNLLSAMRIAAQMGAARIIVTAPDPVEYAKMGHDPVINDALAAGFLQVTANLRAQGVTVDVIERPVAPAPTRRSKSWV